MQCPTCGAAYEGEFACPLRRERRAFGLLSLKPKVCQHHHGHTHTLHLAHAVDYAARVGTPVFASRPGVVVDLVDHFTRGGSSVEFRSKANYVVLFHGERYSRYYHLSSVCVEVGQAVQQGQAIGRTGNTGYTFGPHLHFDVVNMHPKEVCVLRLSSLVVVPCVPLSFSRFPFPPQAQQVEARVCHRGGQQTFRELASGHTGAELVIIIDNDVEMRSALPLLVGDSGERLDRVWVVLVASVHSLPDHCTVELSTHPHFPPLASSSSAFHKPHTIPVTISPPAYSANRTTVCCLEWWYVSCAWEYACSLPSEMHLRISAHEVHSRVANARSSHCTDCCTSIWSNSITGGEGLSTIALGSSSTTSARSPNHGPNTGCTHRCRSWFSMQIPDTWAKRWNATNRRSRSCT